jgi:DNA (cytosine-5)-methyltransferase 1
MASGDQLVLSPDIAAQFPVSAAWRQYTELPWVDLICAGVPCQDVSIAGKRAGLKGKRTGLFFQFARILKELRPTWFVFENVPGLFSSNEGRDFATVLRVLMVECGYGVCWRVLDSQYFGVAQRRRRLFIVGHFGKPCPAEVLFEPESLPRSPAQKRTQEAQVASPLTSGIGVRGKPSGRRMEDDFNLAVLTASNGHHGYCGDRGDGYTLAPSYYVIQDARCQNKRQNGSGITQDGPCYTLDGKSEHAVAYTLRHPSGGGIGDLTDTNLVCGAINTRSKGRGYSVDEAAGNFYVTATLQGGGHSGHGDGTENLVIGSPTHPNGVRKTSRLPRGLDSARYRALGNAVTTHVAMWIAERIRRIDG